MNRLEEIKFLEEKYNSKTAEFIVISGRRRVGKTRLVNEFLNKNAGIYYLCSTSGDKNNIQYFIETLNLVLPDLNLKNIIFNDWYSLFEHLSNNIIFINTLKIKKFIIILDEFPFLIQSNRNTPSEFQRIWELILKKLNVLLIMCGSSVSVMEKEVIGYKSPLYGRRTAQIEVLNLNVEHLSSFFSEYNVEDIINLWGVVGGSPAYLNLLNPNIDFWSNVRSVLSKNNYMFKDAEIILREEFREPKNYTLILYSISIGKNKFSEIVQNTNIDKSKLSKYLEILKNTKIIVENKSVTDSYKNRKKQYLISDSYFNFWFRFIYPNKVFLEAENIDFVLNKIKGEFNTYMGFVFEKVIYNLILHRKILKELNFTNINRWWYKDTEIDLVAIDSNSKDISFIECKWNNKAINAKKIYFDLKEKAKLVKWNNNSRNEKYIIFAKKFTSKINLKDLYLFDLEDIRKALKVKSVK